MQGVCNFAAQSMWTCTGIGDASVLHCSLLRACTWPCTHVNGRNVCMPQTCADRTAANNTYGTARCKLLHR